MLEYLDQDKKSVGQTRIFLNYIGYPLDYIEKLSDEEIMKLYEKEKSEF